MANNAAMNIAEHMSLWYFEHPLDIYPKVILLGLEVGCFLIFWEIIKRAVIACTPTSNAEVFPLSPILSIINCGFDLGHSYRCKIVGTLWSPGLQLLFRWWHFLAFLSLWKLCQSCLPTLLPEHALPWPWQRIRRWGLHLLTHLAGLGINTCWSIWLC